MSFGPWQLAIVALLVLVLFGRGRISEMMGDFGKGIKSFKKGMSDEENASHSPDPSPAKPSAQIEAPSAEAGSQSTGQAAASTESKSDAGTSQ